MRLFRGLSRQLLLPTHADRQFLLHSCSSFRYPFIFLLYLVYLAHQSSSDQWIYPHLRARGSELQGKFAANCGKFCAGVQNVGTVDGELQVDAELDCHDERNGLF
jgi:hypothetical protein